MDQIELRKKFDEILISYNSQYSPSKKAIKEKDYTWIVDTALAILNNDEMSVNNILYNIFKKIDSFKREKLTVTLLLKLLEKNDWNEFRLYDKSKNDIAENKYLLALFDAMEQVGREYGSIITNMDNNPLEIRICERNYIIYLSYILGKLQSDKGHTPFEKDDYINGETYKCFKDLKDELKTAYEDYCSLKKQKKGGDNDSQQQTFSKNKKNKEVVPDFVIHKSHKMNNDFTGQIIIVEAKTTSKLKAIDFFWDLLKLNAYIEEFGFENAVYLIVNTTKEQIDNYLVLYEKIIKFFCKEKSKLWFFIQDLNGKESSQIGIFQLKNNRSLEIERTETIYI